METLRVILPASLQHETFVHAPEEPLLPSELLLWHSQFQPEQKLFPHQQVSWHLLKPINRHKYSFVRQKWMCNIEMMY